MKKMRMIVPVIAGALAICLLAGCSADALMGAGKALGNLGHATLDNGGDALVDEAAGAVAGFIEEYESYIDFSAASRSVDETGKETIDGSVMLSSEENMAKISAMVDSLTTVILRSRETSSSDKALRAELDTPYSDYDGVKRTYKGNTIEWNSYANVGNLIDSSTVVAMLVSMVAGMGRDLTGVTAVNLPLPIQTSEILIPLTAVAPKMMAHLAFFQKIGKGEGGGKITAEDFKYIQEGIAAYVGDRNYETVGDKIAWCMVLDIANTFTEVLDKYLAAYPDEKDENGQPSYESLNAQFLLGKCEAELDKAMSCLEVLGYIYDFNIDVAGLAGKLL